mmetsp:Transcript_88129/g.244616  ORF Transcript_88129/g.244616 Transcript_88129/m.244616 type:complete len:247 (+) Transcript_88129:81-821(+)
MELECLHRKTTWCLACRASPSRCLVLGPAGLGAHSPGPREGRQREPHVANAGDAALHRVVPGVPVEHLGPPAHRCLPRTLILNGAQVRCPARLEHSSSVLQHLYRGTDRRFPQTPEWRLAHRRVQRRTRKPHVPHSWYSALNGAVNGIECEDLYVPACQGRPGHSALGRVEPCFVVRSRHRSCILQDLERVPKPGVIDAAERRARRPRIRQLSASRLLYSSTLALCLLTLQNDEPAFDEPALLRLL